MLCLLLLFAKALLLFLLAVVLSQVISHGMRLLAWEFILIICTFSVLASFRLLLLLLLLLLLICSYRCAEALVVNMKFSIESPLLRLEVKLLK